MAAEPSFYLSFNIPLEIAQRITRELQVSGNVRVHEASNMHVTLEFLGTLNTQEVEALSAVFAQVVANSRSFTLTLRATDLRDGSPEGYRTSHAWYLDVEEGKGGAQFREIRHKLFEKLNLEESRKEFHVTLASEKSSGGTATFANDFSYEIPVREIVLMESAPGEGKRVYRVKKQFTLAN